MTTEANASNSSGYNRSAAMWVVLLLIFVGVLCYGNTLSVPFLFDDYPALVKNPEITGGRELWDILLHGGPRRIADFSFAVNYRLHGLQLFGYHLTNLVIHLSATVVLYFLAAAILKALRPVYSGVEADRAPLPLCDGMFIPLAAALIFVCHPLQTQAVTYIIQRHTSLAALFYLLSLLAYVSGRMALDTGRQSRVFVWGGVLVLSAVLAFYTKQITYSMPLMLLLLEIMLFRSRLSGRYLVAAGAGVILLSAMLLPMLLNSTAADLIFDLRHATFENMYTTRLTYFLTQTRVVVTYLRLLILPTGQNLDYDYPLYTSILNSEVMASLALHAALLAAAITLYRRSRQLNTAEGHCQRTISLGIGWFYIALLVESSFIPITDVIMEHRVYLPSAGFCLAVAALLRLICLKCRNGARWRWCAVALICVVFAVLTVQRNRLWGDDVAFWQDAVAKSPRKGRVHSNLGWAYLNHGRYEESLKKFVDAVRLDARLDNYSWIMLGKSLEGTERYRGRFTTGEEYLTSSGKVNMRWYSQFSSVKFNNMGLVMEHVGRPEEALSWYRQAVAVNPGSDFAWFNLGQLSARLGDSAMKENALARLKVLNSVMADKLVDKLEQN